MANATREALSRAHTGEDGLTRYPHPAQLRPTDSRSPPLLPLGTKTDMQESFEDSLIDLAVSDKWTKEQKREIFERIINKDHVCNMLHVGHPPLIQRRLTPPLA